MIGAMLVIAICAGISTAIGMAEMLSASQPGATVFQQISARVDVGLSLIVFTLALGFIGVLRRMDGAIKNLTPPKPVDEHRGVPIYKTDIGFTAQVGGKAIHSGRMADLKGLIDQKS